MAGGTVELFVRGPGSRVFCFSRGLSASVVFHVLTAHVSVCLCVGGNDQMYTRYFVHLHTISSHPSVSSVGFIFKKKQTRFDANGPALEHCEAVPDV